MNTKILTGFCALLAAAGMAHGQATAFTYDGMLKNTNTRVLANGDHDFAFTIFDASTGGNVVGATIIHSNVMVDNGVFTVTLDFGNGVFTGATRWMEIAVRASGGGSLQILSPRQKFTSTPYAVKAMEAENVTGKVPADQIEGEINTDKQLPDYGIELEKLSGSVVSNTFWRLNGNAGTTAANFLGTTDNQPLELRIGGQRALRLENGGGGLNLIVGTGMNSITDSSFSSVLGGWNNHIFGNSSFSVIGGGDYHQILANAAASTIGGGEVNVIWPGATFATISGGYSHNIHDDSAYSFIGGGYYNAILSNSGRSTISGGSGNVIQADSTNATISGGIGNNILQNSQNSLISGGSANLISSDASSAVIGGGINNRIEFLSANATIAGGQGNVISNYSSQSVIGGGSGNQIRSGSELSTIGGGAGNWIGTNSSRGVISGGVLNRIAANSIYATIGGGASNEIGTNATATVIGGGDGNHILANASLATIAGGYRNTVSTNADFATIGGGGDNRIQEDAAYATIVGGQINLIGPNSSHATIGGGLDNGIAADASLATISGGRFNDIGLSSGHSVIGGGFDNDIGPNTIEAVIGGGHRNKIGVNSETATIAGGYFNEIGTNSLQSTIGGGYDNTVLSEGQYATIPGGFQNAATNFAFAAGRRAKANHTGTFVWADAQNADFASTSNHQFLIRASGGVGIGTNNPQSALHVRGIVTADGFAGDGSGLSNLISIAVVTNNYTATNLISDDLLPATVARLNSNQTFSAANVFSGVVTATNAANLFTGQFNGVASGNGGGLTNLNLGSTAVPWLNLTGVPAGFADGVDNDTTYSAGSGLALSGTQFSVNFAGSGAAITASRSDHSHDATNITSGTLNDGRLSTNVALLIGPQTFSGAKAMTNAGNTFVGAFTGSFTGNGAGLTNLNLGTGTGVAFLGSNQLFTSSNTFNGVVTAGNANNSLNGSFTGTHTGNGAGVTNLNPANLTAGTAAINVSGNAATATTAGSAANFTGSLAGDVTGTQAATTVARLRGVTIDPTAPTANQHLRYNGANWTPGAVALATDVSGTLPIINGGTGAGTAAQAVANLGAASLTASNGFSGVNTMTNVANKFVGNFHGNGAGLTNLNLGSASVPWSSLTNVPAGFADGVDNDTTYSAGTGLTLVGSQFNVSFGGSGAATTASRSDHTHSAADITGGTLNDLRLSGNVALRTNQNIFLASNIFSGVVVAANLANQFVGTFNGIVSGNGAGLTNLPISAVTNAWNLTGNAGTSPSVNFLGTTDNQALEFKVNGSRALRLEPNVSSPNVIGGYSGNFASNGVVGAVIAGGGRIAITNIVGGSYSFVGGGRGHLTVGLGSTIGGGSRNTAFGLYSTVGGGADNVVSNAQAVVSGGSNNIAGAQWSVVAGGAQNYLSENAAAGCIGGGLLNSNLSLAAAISGGMSNRIEDESEYSVIGGGTGNVIDGRNVQAFALYGTIPGGRDNSVKGEYGFAAGRRAKAHTTGSFVWGDSTDEDFISTGFDQFLVRAAGGVGIGLNNPAAQLEVSSGGGDSFPQARINQTDITNYARLRFTVDGDYSKRWDLAVRSNVFVIYSGQTSSEALRLENNNAYVNGALVLTSDRNAKENFRPVDSRAVLDKVAALPLQEWNYRTDAERSRHVGPMAQDFRAAFGLGTDDKHIATVDADGVALAAIQGLNEKVEAGSQQSEVRSRKLEERLQQKETEITELRIRLEQLEQLINRKTK